MEKELTALETASLGYRQAKDRYMVLGECLTMVEALKRRFSKNENSLAPKEGYERAFEAEEERLRVLREMMREERSRLDNALMDIAKARKEG